MNVLADSDGADRLTDRQGPLLQSITIGFRAVYLATLVLALVWLAAGIRQVPADTRAVVFRFGRVVRVQSAGLLLALPRPIETVAMIPGADRQLSQTVAASPRAAGLDDVVDIANGEPQQGSAGGYLTADGGVVLLDAALTYRISDPVAYVIAQAHVAPALDRLFRSAAIAVAARHRLDDFLVTRPDLTLAAQAAVAPRQAVRDELVQTLNARLRALAVQDAGFGAEIERIDITAYLPPAAKRAFDAVLSAAQRADQSLARARTDAERRRQQADRDRDRLLTVARADAAERVSRAHAQTARINALAAQPNDARDSLMDRLYRDRIAQLFRQIGHVTTIDARGGARVILPGSASPGTGQGSTP